jgi:hypothetical protein
MASCCACATIKHGSDWLGVGSAQSDAYRVGGVRQGLKEAGFIEGQNLTIEYRWAEDHYDRLPAMAADLVRHHGSDCRDQRISVARRKGGNHDAPDRF